MSHLRWFRPAMLAASVLCADALQAQQHGRVRGVVVDQLTGAPVEGVHVSGPRRVTMTDQRGGFELCGLTSGRVDLVVARHGYYRLTPTVTIGANALPPLRLTMTRDSAWRPEPADAPAEPHAGIGRPSRIGVVLDGQRFLQSSDGCGATAETPLVELSAVDPASIDSIEVLMAADAARSYGFTGVDGAIIVTTKRPSAP
jgi:hypothetical protein